MDIIKLDKCWKAPLVSFLAEISPDLPRPLIGRVDLEEYAEKLLTKGCVVAIPNGCELTGICGGYVNDYEGRRSVITIMGVRAASRKGGEGTRLINHFTKIAIEFGMRTLELETHKTNARAISFYKKNGFELINYLGNDNVLMRKRIVGLCGARPNILLTSVGRRTYLVEWFKQALNGYGEVHVVNSDPLSPAFAVADKSTTSPLIYSPQYLPFLIDYVKKNKIGAILSLFDIDIPVLSRHKLDFKREGCFPVVADFVVADFCNDKYETFIKLRDAGLPTVPTFVKLDACETALKDGSVSFPLILKPRWGMGSIGVYSVCNLEELRAVYGLVRRKVEDTYLRFESSVDLDNSVLMQASMNGQEYGLDVINDLEGHFQSVIVRRKIAMRAGETDVAEVLPADDRFEQLAKTISAMSLHPGNMDVDVFDVDGRLYVLEMNARFGGGYPFSHTAGVNLPLALIKWLKGERASIEMLSPDDYGTYLKDIRIVQAPKMN